VPARLEIRSARRRFVSGNYSIVFEEIQQAQARVVPIIGFRSNFMGLSQEAQLV
jgi:hypothetical protein